MIRRNQFPRVRIPFLRSSWNPVHSKRALLPLDFRVSLDYSGGKAIGEVKNWNEEKGFGFVIPQGGGDDVFAHRVTTSAIIVSVMIAD